LGYDTIYGTQDISDDEIIGLKSTALKFKNNIKKFVTVTYIITITSIIYLFKDSFKFDVSTFFIFLFFISLVYQIIKFKKNQPALCLHAFKLNNYSGLFLFLGIFLINN
jgi:4-hydroxybenzoate polyprenyltransferase